MILTSFPISSTQGIFTPMQPTQDYIQFDGINLYYIFSIEKMAISRKHGSQAKQPA